MAADQWLYSAESSRQSSEQPYLNPRQEQYSIENRELREAAVCSQTSSIHAHASAGEQYVQLVTTDTQDLFACAT